MEDKIPPQDLDAEQSVLGAMMISKDAAAIVAGELRADHFYRDSHIHIFEAVLDLYRENEPIDLVTVSNQLKKQNKLEEAGGRTYLAEIIDSVPTAANAEKYAGIVLEKAMGRKLIEADRWNAHGASVWG